MIQSTSKEAYQEIKRDLGRRQQEVLNFIRNHPSVSNLGIAEGLNLPINSVTPRVKELREAGLVEEDSIKPSPSGRNAIHWRLSAKQLTLFIAFIFLFSFLITKQDDTVYVSDPQTGQLVVCTKVDDTIYCR